MTERWRTTLRHVNFVKAIVNREFRPFRRFHEDLIAEGIIAYYMTLESIEKTRMRWIAIRNHLWAYIDDRILCHRNRNRKEAVSTVNLSAYDRENEHGVTNTVERERLVEDWLLERKLPMEGVEGYRVRRYAR